MDVGSASRIPARNSGHELDHAGVICEQGAPQKRGVVSLRRTVTAPGTVLPLAVLVAMMVVVAGLAMLVVSMLPVPVVTVLVLVTRPMVIVIMAGLVVMLKILIVFMFVFMVVFILMGSMPRLLVAGPMLAAWSMLSAGSAWASCILCCRHPVVQNGSEESKECRSAAGLTGVRILVTENVHPPPPFKAKYFLLWLMRIIVGRGVRSKMTPRQQEPTSVTPSLQGP